MKLPKTREERLTETLRAYERLFDIRGGVTPTDPLEFHLYHLARYWSRLVGFCRMESVKPEGCIEGDLGVTVEIGSAFAHKLIEPTSTIYNQWTDYWSRTQRILHESPVTLADVEAASESLNKCFELLHYNPWGTTETNNPSSS